MNPQNDAVFLLPTSLDGQQGPVAAWLNTAGWVGAAARLGFGSTVITSSGIVDANSLRRRAALPTTKRATSSRLTAKLPLALKVAIKDAREWMRSQKFTRIVLRTNLPNHAMAFVWQRHELFHHAGAKLAHRLGCPLVLYVPAPKVWEARSWGIRRPGWEAVVEHFGDLAPLRQADLVACVSDEVADALVSLGISPSQIIVTPSTADTELFRPGVDGSESRDRHSLEGRFVVGWTGSFRSFHGLDLLVDAAQEARRQVPHMAVLLVGNGPERVRLEAEVERRGLEDTVRFIDPVPQNELPELMAAFDVAVVTSRADQVFHYSPLKLWEYLATGLAVVAPAVGVPGRMLKDGVDAMLYPPGDVASLVSILVTLAGDAPLRSSLGEAGRRHAEQESWTQQVGRVTDRLHVLTTKNGP